MGDHRYRFLRDHKSGADCQGADADSPVELTWCPSGCFSVFCVGEKKIVSTHLYICPLNRHLERWRMEAYTEQ